MNVQILHNNEDITNRVISYHREHVLCDGTGSINLEIQAKDARDFDPYDTIKLYEEGVKKGEYYLSEITTAVPDTTYRITAQDASKKLVDYFITTEYLIDYYSTARYWVELFLTEVGVSYSINTSSQGGTLSNNTSLGMNSAYDTLTTLCQMSGWYFYFDEDNVCQIGKAALNSGSVADSFDETTIIKYSSNKHDRMLRNRAVVWGAGNALTNEWVFADVHVHTPYNYDNNDLRAVVLSNSNISNYGSATSLAQTMLKEFAQINYEKTISVAGVFEVSIGDLVEVSTRAFSGTGKVTTVEVDMSKNGLVTTLTLDQRCPRIFGFFSYDGYVYIGTAGQGVWRKPFDVNYWENYSLGLVDLNVVDLYIKNGVLACVTSDGSLYYTRTSVNYWIKYTPPTLVDSDGVTYEPTSVRAVACSINDENIIQAGYSTISGVPMGTTISGMRSWVVELNGMGTFTEQNDVRIINSAGELTSEVVILDIESGGSANTVSVSGNGVTGTFFELGTLLNSNKVNVDYRMPSYGPIESVTPTSSTFTRGDAAPLIHNNAVWEVKKSGVITFVSYDNAGEHSYTVPLTDLDPADTFTNIVFRINDVDRFDIVSGNFSTEFFHYVYYWGDANMTLYYHYTNTGLTPTSEEGDVIYAGNFVGMTARSISAGSSEYILYRYNLDSVTLFTIFTGTYTNSYTVPAPGSPGFPGEIGPDSQYYAGCIPFKFNLGDSCALGLIFEKHTGRWEYTWDFMGWAWHFKSYSSDTRYGYGWFRSDGVVIVDGLNFDGGNSLLYISDALGGAYGAANTAPSEVFILENAVYDNFGAAVGTDGLTDDSTGRAIRAVWYHGAVGKVFDFHEGVTVGNPLYTRSSSPYWYTTSGGTVVTFYRGDLFYLDATVAPPTKIGDFDVTGILGDASAIFLQILEPMDDFDNDLYFSARKGNPGSYSYYIIGVGTTTKIIPVGAVDSLYLGWLLNGQFLLTTPYGTRALYTSAIASLPYKCRIVQQATTGVAGEDTFTTIYQTHWDAKVEISKYTPRLLYPCSGGAGGLYVNFPADPLNTFSLVNSLPYDARVFDISAPATYWGTLVTNPPTGEAMVRYIGLIQTNGLFIRDENGTDWSQVTVQTLEGVTVTSGAYSHLEATNNEENPHIFVAVSGELLFFQKNPTSNFWVNHAVNLPSANITIIRTDDQV